MWGGGCCEGAGGRKLGHPLQSKHVCLSASPVRLGGPREVRGGSHRALTVVSHFLLSFHLTEKP